MAANITYRASLTPTIPASTTAKLASLTNLEVDANFKALSDEVNLKSYLNSPTFTGVVTLPINSIAPGILGSASSTVVAAGTNQASATVLVSDINIITTATANQGVVVPGATSGKYAVVVNRTSVVVILYPYAGHSFDSLSVNTGIALPAGAYIEIYGYSNTQWSTTYQALTQAQYIVGAVAVTSGGTGATTAPAALANLGAASLGANTFTGAQEFATGTAIASASTINLDTATGNRIHVTGTTTINAVTLTRGPRTVIFDGILTLTYNATTNKLQGGLNITTAVGDIALYESDGSVVYCTYIRADGTSVGISNSTATSINSLSYYLGNI
jgi:hypothetical protein